jgi:hypothetical protein
MPKFNLPGVGEIETQGNGLSTYEFDAIRQVIDNRQSVDNVGYASTADLVDPNTGYYNLPEIDTHIRYLVSASPNLESTVKTLRKYFTDIKQDEFDPTNFIVTDDKGKKFIVDDKRKTNLKDVIDFGKDITQMATSTAGAVVGSAAGPVGTIAGAGLGLAAGSEAYERVAQLAGLEIDRTVGDYLATRAGEVALGSIAQGVAPVAIKGLKWIIRGGEADAVAMRSAIADFRAIDPKIRPTLGMVTENKVIDQIENTFANVPFSAPVMRQAAETTQNQMGEAVGNLVSKGLNFAKPVTSEQAGKVIQESIKGTGKGKLGLGATEFGIDNQVGWLQKFKNTSAKLYDDVKVPDKLPVSLTNTQAFLKKEIGEFKGIEPIAKLFQDPKVAKMYEGLQKSAVKTADGIETGAMTYTQAKQLRTYIGQKLASASLIDTTPRSVYKRMYGELTNDINRTVATVGKDAIAKAQLADNFYKTNIKAWDDFLEPIAKKADLDNLVPQLLKKSKEGSTTIRGVVGELTDEQKKVFASAFIDKLGKTEISGDLQVLGRTNSFNTSQFLKNWQNITPEAKDVLFSGSKELSLLKNSLDQVARAGTRFDRQNPFKDIAGTTTKGTGGTGLFIASGAGAVVGATGNPLFLLGIPIFGYGGAYATKLMSNPKFVDWLAKGTKIADNKGFDGVVKHLTSLGTIAGMSDNDTRTLTDQYMEILKQTSGKFENKVTEATKGAAEAQNAAKQAAVKQATPMGPVNTNITNIKQPVLASPAPTSGRVSNERIDEYNRLEQFV